jgi:hypothetical protein
LKLERILRVVEEHFQLIKCGSDVSIQVCEPDLRFYGELGVNASLAAPKKAARCEQFRKVSLLAAGIYDFVEPDMGELITCSHAHTETRCFPGVCICGIFHVTIRLCCTPKHRFTLRMRVLMCLREAQPAMVTAGGLTWQDLARFFTPVN